MARNIPGRLNARALAALAANDRPSVWQTPPPDNAAALRAAFGDAPEVAHAPRDRHEFRAAARSMKDRGIPLGDISVALKLRPHVVEELLRETPPSDPLRRFK